MKIILPTKYFKDVERIVTKKDKCRFILADFSNDMSCNYVELEMENGEEVFVKDNKIFVTKKIHGEGKVKNE